MRTGQTPLHVAAWWGSPSLVKLLLQWGAKLSVTDNDGKTPLDLAREDNDNSRAKDSKALCEILDHYKYTQSE